MSDRSNVFGDSWDREIGEPGFRVRLSRVAAALGTELLGATGKIYAHAGVGADELEKILDSAAELEWLEGEPTGLS